MKTDASSATILEVNQKTMDVRPLFTSGVSAGFPSPAEDHIDRKLDLNELLIQHPVATFFVRVAGVNGNRKLYQFWQNKSVPPI